MSGGGGAGMMGGGDRWRDGGVRKWCMQDGHGGVAGWVRGLFWRHKGKLAFVGLVLLGYLVVLVLPYPADWRWGRDAGQNAYGQEEDWSFGCVGEYFVVQKDTGWAISPVVKEEDRVETRTVQEWSLWGYSWRETWTGLNGAKEMRTSFFMVKWSRLYETGMLMLVFTWIGLLFGPARRRSVYYDSFPEEDDR